MSSEKNIRFIVNPISGIGKQKIIPRLIEQNLDTQQFDYEICYTEGPKHATKLAKEAAENGVHIVAIVGGDGSMNEAATGLVGTETCLAIIPTGSGNGLARHLNIPLKLADAIRLLNKHKVRKIDTGIVNNHSFIGVAGVGFDALIAKQFSDYGKRGFFSYFKIVLREFIRYKEDEYKIRSGEQEFNNKAFLVTIANSSQYGNRFTIDPNAIIDDGKANCCVLSSFPIFMVPFVAWRFYNKTIHKSKYMTIVPGHEFIIQKKSPLVHVDGEPLVIEGEAVFSLRPQSLRVIVPV